jgi:hypothetical protein
MNILFIGVDTVVEYNCEDWRIAIPFRACRRAGIPCEYMHVNQWMTMPHDDPITAAADLIVYQRNIFGEALVKLAYWRLRCKPMVLDLDDAYHLMTKDTGSPSFKFWGQAILEEELEVRVKDEKGVEKVEKRIEPHPVEPKPLVALESGAKLMGAVSSPSKLILRDWEPYGVKTYWLPNYLEEKRYLGWEQYHTDTGLVRIGGGGSLTHLVSWQKSGLVDALDQLAAENPKVNLVLLGDERQHKFLKMRPAQRIKLGWVPPSLYGQSMARVDLGVIPLYGEYDRRRSWIKAAEYAVMGIPWIATDSDPYHDLPVSGCGRLVQNTAAAWYEALKDMVAHVKDARAEAAKYTAAAVEAYGIDHNIGNLSAIYQQIIEETE